MASRPWRAFLLVLLLNGVSFALVGVILYRLLGLPQDLGHIEALPTAAHFTLSGLLGYLFVPFLLRLPKGSRSFRAYLDDIRITTVRPFIPLAGLTASCVLILMACQGTGSIVYRLAEGNPVTIGFLAQVFDLGAALPPQSMLLFAEMFSSLEEVLFRGVLLTMLIPRYGTRKAIIYSAAAFGLMHLPSVFAGTPMVTALAQVTWAFLFGLAYGHIFITSGSLIPVMVLHWLSNVFQEPLTAYWTSAPVTVRAFYGVVFGYGIAAMLIIPWVKYFAARWLPRSEAAGDVVAG